MNKTEQKKTIKGGVSIFILLILLGAFLPMLQNQISQAGVGFMGNILILMVIVGVALVVIGWALQRADVL